MEVAVLRQRWSYAALVAEGVRRARHGETIRDVARHLLDEFEPTPDSVEEMFRVALISGINARINAWDDTERTAVLEASFGVVPALGGTDDLSEFDRISGSTQRPQTGLPGTPRHLRYQAALENLNYEGADGIRRALIDFTLDDCLAFRERMVTMSRGAALKARAMKVAAEALRKHKKDRIGDLPDSDRDEIAKYLTKAKD